MLAIPATIIYRRTDMNRTLSTSFISFALLSAALAGCGGQGSNNGQQQTAVTKSNAQRVTDPQVSAADRATFASDNEAFALAAYQKMVPLDGNIVFSPASISIALAMAYAGAAGTTASEMAAALHYTLPPARLHPAFDWLDLQINSRGEGKLGADGGPMRLHVVNAAWAERTYTFKSDYLDVLATSYGAGINLLDFLTGSESARLTINAWVAGQTENKILDLLPTGAVDSSTRLVLTNAVYFNAAWKQAFDPQNTHDFSFTLLDGSQVTTKFMGAELANTPAVQGEGFVAVELPYQDEQLSMLVVVPDGGTFAAFESSLDAGKLDTIIAGLTPQAILLSLPRFKVETGQGLEDLLKALGMTSAFEFGPADFSSMDGTRNLYVSKVIHKAFIDVAEKGTEAAAATAVTMSAGAMPVGLNIDADRPFLYFLRDQPTGAILFMGRVLDPTKN
jgi:serpin B